MADPTGIGSARAGGSAIANAIVSAQVVGPAVLVRDDGTTRVAETSLAVNYIGDDALNVDAHVRLLILQHGAMGGALPVVRDPSVGGLPTAPSGILAD